jgi:hypothetical protein
MVSVLVLMLSATCLARQCAAASHACRLYCRPQQPCNRFSSPPSRKCSVPQKVIDLHRSQDSISPCCQRWKDLKQRINILPSAAACKNLSTNHHHVIDGFSAVLILCRVAEPQRSRCHQSVLYLVVVHLPWKVSALLQRSKDPLIFGKDYSYRNETMYAWFEWTF